MKTDTYTNVEVDTVVAGGYIQCGICERGWKKCRVDRQLLSLDRSSTANAINFSISNVDDAIYEFPLVSVSVQ